MSSAGGDVSIGKQGAASVTVGKQGAVAAVVTGAMIGSAAFDPINPPSGTAKAIYEFDDLARLWQDVAKTTPVASNGDPIGYVENRVPDGADFTASSNRPTWGSAGVATFDGSQFLTTDTQNYWTFLHDGTRVLVFVQLTFSPPGAGTGHLIGGVLSASDIGFFVAFSNSLGVFSGSTNGSAFWINSSGGAVPGTDDTVAVRLEDGLAGDDLIARVNGTETNQANRTAAPSSSNPTHVLLLGKQAGGFNFYVGTVSKIWIFEDMDDADIPETEAAIAL